MRLVINVFLYRFFLNLFGRNKRYRFNIYLTLVIAYHSECRVILSLREVKSEIHYLPPPELVRYLLRAVLHGYKVNIPFTTYTLILNVAVLASGSSHACFHTARQADGCLSVPKTSPHYRQLQGSD